MRNTVTDYSAGHSQNISKCTSKTNQERTLVVIGGAMGGLPPRRAFLRDRISPPLGGGHGAWSYWGLVILVCVANLSGELGVGPKAHGPPAGGRGIAGGVGYPPLVP